MPEPTSSAAGAAGIAAYKAGLLTKAAVALSSGVLGAVVIAFFDPPKTRREMFGQALAAGVGSIFFGPAAVRGLDYVSSWIDLSVVDVQTYWEFAAPVYLVVGALAWGAFGALAKFRAILRDRGADRAAKMTGLGEDKAP